MTAARFFIIVAFVMTVGVLFGRGAGASHAAHDPHASDAALLSCSAQTVFRAYFGFDTPNGPVSEAAWQAFVDAEVSPRLPAGFTVLSAQGQWRGDDGVIRREDSRVLEVLGADEVPLRQALATLAGRYKQRFRQQAVLVTQAPLRVCV
jgi:Protein of unknown function (DUF3574)